MSQLGNESDGTKQEPAAQSASSVSTLASKGSKDVRPKDRACSSSWCLKDVDLTDRSKVMEEWQNAHAEETELRLYKHVDACHGAMVQSSGEKSLMRKQHDDSCLNENVLSSTSTKHSSTGALTEGIAQTVNSHNLADAETKERQSDVDHHHCQQSAVSESLTDAGFTEKCFLINRSVKVVLSKQDITQMRVDAIVNLMASSLEQANVAGISSENKACSKYADDYQKATFSSVGVLHVKKTSVDNAPSKMVLQVVIPGWPPNCNKEEQLISSLKAIFCNVIEAAERLKLCTVAFPANTGGKYNEQD